MSVVRASTEALGLKAIFADYGLELDLQIFSDATAAIGMVSRLGLGRVRHLAVADLWVQDKARTGQIKYAKVDGKRNPSDSMTKAVDAPTLQQHLAMIGIVSLAGRAEVAPKAKLAEERAADA